MRESKRGAKTESLSLRIDPKTKFVLDFMVRVRGLRITDLIEQAIKDYAEKTTIGGTWQSEEGKSWLHYWHPEEGVRTIKLIMDSDVKTSFEEDEIVDFVNQHHEFFLTGHAQHRQPTTVFIQVIWPNIYDYLEHWRENKATDRWSTGMRMLQAIKAAGMKGPEWPRMSKAAVPATFQREELDDEIPF